MFINGVQHIGNGIAKYSRLDVSYNETFCFRVLI